MQKLSIQDLINALLKLKADSIPQWGMMSAPQMLRHCNLQIRLYSSEKPTSLVSILRTYTMGRLHLLYVKYYVRYDIHRYKKTPFHFHLSGPLSLRILTLIGSGKN